MEELSYSLNTLYMLFCTLVMWMAAGFTMLEAGLVEEEICEIVTKNVGLYSISCHVLVVWLLGHVSGKILPAAGCLLLT